VVGEHDEIPDFHPRHWQWHQPPWNGPTNNSEDPPSSVVSAPVYTNEVLQLVSVVQKNRPLTMLSFIVHCIDFPVKHMA